MENNVEKVNFKETAIYTVETAEAPKAIGPYVQGKVVNGMLYASGQIALDPTSGEMVGGNDRGSNLSGIAKRWWTFKSGRCGL
jgi:hypothetical protein